MQLGFHPQPFLLQGLALYVIADALEQLVADDLWPLPKYREMLLSGV